MAHPSLNPSEAERLELLIEECSEVIQASTKILRHGYDSSHPDRSPMGDTVNRDDLQDEVADVQAVLTMMENEQDIEVSDTDLVDRAIIRKLRYTRHQRGSEL